MIADNPAKNVPEARLLGQGPPIYRLPSELLSEILIFATLPFEPVQTPVRLASITSRLRLVALHTPGLWISVAFPREIRFSPLDLLELHLSRSRAALLEVAADIPFDVVPLHWKYHDYYTPQNPERVSLLRDIIPRIVSLKIDELEQDNDWRLNDQEPEESLAELNCPAPELRHLTICLNLTDIPESFLQSCMPKLRTVLLMGQTHAQAAEFLGRCRPLQELTLRIFEPEPPEDEEALQMLQVLRVHSPTLVTLHITILINTAYVYEIPRGSLIFPHLRTLTIIAANPGLVDPITSLRLEEFGLECKRAEYVLYDEDTPVQCYTVLYHFVRRHLSSLREMSILAVGYPDFPWDAATVPRTPAVYPSLKSLSLTMDAAYAEQLCRLSAPTLETLALDFGERYAIPWSSLMSCLSNHSEHLVNLSVVSATFFPLAMGDIMETSAISFPSLQTFYTYGADLILLRIKSAPKLHIIEIRGPESDAASAKPFGYYIHPVESLDTYIIPTLCLPELVSILTNHPSCILFALFAPKLQHVKLRSPAAESNSLRFVSQHATSITSMRLYGNILNTSDSGEKLTPIILPELSALIVGWDAPIPDIQCPSLRSLSLLPHNFDPSSLHIFTSVTHLFIDDAKDLWALEPLKNVVELCVTLSLVCTPRRAALLKALAAPSKAGTPPEWLFPALHSLTTTFFTNTDERDAEADEKALEKFDFGVFKELVAARKNAMDVVANITGLTLVKGNQPWMWGMFVPYTPDSSYIPASEAQKSPLSEELSQWLHSNVARLVLKSHPREP